MSAVRTLSMSVLQVLERASVDALDGVTILRIPHLERHVYLDVAEAVKPFGLIWSRAKQALTARDLTISDLQERLDIALSTGTVTDWKQALGFFETPEDLALRLVEAAEVRPGDRVLEPSAGKGAIARCLPRGVSLYMVEINSDYRWNLEDILRGRAGAHGLVTGKSFLDVSSAPPWGAFDAIVMNPPFAKQADVDHVLHALTFLRPGGRLAAIMSSGVNFRQDSKAKNFRKVVAAAEGTVTPLPESSFAASGTDVRTVLVTLVKR